MEFNKINKKELNKEGKSLMVCKTHVPRMIVSLTSYPKRIEGVHKVIESLLNQTMKPFKIILWLAKEEFLNKNTLPQDLTSLISEYFEICWCDDIKSHKKYFFSLIQYPKDCIITVDDDCIYPVNLVELLYLSYAKHPYAISTIRGRIMDWDADGNLKRYEDWILADDDFVGIQAMDLVPIGMGGVLYPPNIFPIEVLNKEYIIANCLYTDDLWLKVMHALNNVPVVLASGYYPIHPIEKMQETALWISNLSGENDRVMQKLIQDYNDYRDDGIYLTELLIGNYETTLWRQRAEKRQKIKYDIHKKLLSWKNIIIYGAGFVGKKALEILREIEGLEIRCFAITCRNDCQQYIENVPVYSISELHEFVNDSLVVISTDQKYHDEIVATLETYNFNNYLLLDESVLRMIK